MLHKGMRYDMYFGHEILREERDLDDTVNKEM